MMDIIKSLTLFVLAGICEVGGGYLIWLGIKEGRGPMYVVMGLVIMALYGVVPTLQRASFVRIYTAYGGFFILLSLLWGWIFDRNKPDTWDIIGSMIVVVGIVFIAYLPRH
jgi:small multidrug resistance family-3 protein